MVLEACLTYLARGELDFDCSRKALSIGWYESFCPSIYNGSELALLVSVRRAGASFSTHFSMAMCGTCHLRLYDFN